MSLSQCQWQDRDPSIQDHFSFFISFDSSRTQTRLTKIHWAFCRIFAKFLAKERLCPIVGCKVNESAYCCRLVHNNIDYSFPQVARSSFKTLGIFICYNQIHFVTLGTFNDIIKVGKVPKHGSYLTNHWSVQRNKLFIDLREVRLPWPSIAIILTGKMMAIMILARNHWTHLVFWDLDTDVEELTVCLYISVVAAGHLVLAGEGCVRQIVGAQVGRPHLGPDCAGTP